MTWQARMQTTSFAGVEFRFDYVTDETGQRINIYNPITALPTTRALGRTIRRFIIRGYIMGDDPHLQADKLRAACNNGKADTLIHPYLGAIECRINQLSLRDEKTAGGIVYFTAQFIESREAAGLTQLAAPREDAGKSAEELREQLRRLIGYDGGATAEDLPTFSDESTPPTQTSPSYRRAIAVARKLAARDFITAAQIAASPVSRETLAKAHNLYNTTRRATGNDILTIGNASQIITTLADSPADIADIINFITDIGGNITQTTEGRVSRAATTAAISSAAKTLTTGIAAHFVDRQSAAAAQDNILTAAAIESANADSDEVAIALTTTAAAISEVFDDELPSLPQLRQVATRRRNAATLLAEINGKLDDGDIDALMRQNEIAHPLLLPPSVEILRL